MIPASLLTRLSPVCTNNWAGDFLSIKLNMMGVTTELRNIGDAELCREIVARIEHALSDKAGEWHIAITGSRETQDWELKVDGPNGFERSYSLAGNAGSMRRIQL